MGYWQYNLVAVSSVLTSFSKSVSNSFILQQFVLNAYEYILSFSYRFSHLE